MRKCFLLFAAAVLTASAAAATDNGFGGAFLGYNWVRFNRNSSASGTSGLSSFDLNGGNTQVAYTLSPGIGLVLDVGAVHAGSLFGLANSVTASRPNVDHLVTNFVLGPRTHSTGTSVRCRLPKRCSVALVQHAST